MLVDLIGLLVGKKVLFGTGRMIGVNCWVNVVRIPRACPHTSSRQHSHSMLHNPTCGGYDGDECGIDDNTPSSTAREQITNR
jgi:hypothetical protein